MDPPNTFAQKERQIKKRIGQCRICFEKIGKFQLFFDKNGPEKYFWKKLSQHAAQSNGVPLINAKILAFRSLL